MVANYYGIFLPISLVLYACHFEYINDAGFDKNESFKACCGAHGPYNVDESMVCGSKKSTVCSDPSKHINWDGAHFTEAAYKLIAKGLVEGPFADPPLKSPPFKIA